MTRGFTLALIITVQIGAQQPTPPPRSLSLTDAVGTALSQSGTMAIARAGLTRARGQVTQARSEFLPQLFGTLSYTRTLKSQYAPLTGLKPNQFELCTIALDSTATPAQRQAALASAQTCPSQLSGNIFSSVGIGALNAYNIGLSFSQQLFNGQMLAAAHAASAPERAAQLEITAQRAQVTFDVSQAYYDAVLADAFATIADSTMAMDERTLAQARTARRIGNASEFDLLESQVTRDNQVPVVLQAKAGRDERYLRLKQLIGLPLDAPLTLTTTIEEGITDTLPFAAGDTTVDHRSSVREEREAIVANQALLSESRAEYFPSLSLTSSYQRVAFPTGGLPAWNSFLNNWTIGVTASVPIFNGFKTHGDVLVAQANLETEKARYDQARDAAALDARSAIAELRAAEASWRAVSTSSQQAVQAYEIAELRYREGLSSLVELTGARLARQQSFSNRAQAARNLQVARMRATLIRDLPLMAR